MWWALGGFTYISMVNKRVWCAFPILRHDRVQGLPPKGGDARGASRGG